MFTKTNKKTKPSVNINFKNQMTYKWNAIHTIFYDISVNELYDIHATKDGLYITIWRDYYNQTEFAINVVGWYIIHSLSQLIWYLQITIITRQHGYAWYEDAQICRTV